jgi:hypothetical protein
MTDTEQHRHRCEVRWCISRGAEWAKTYAASVAKRRGRLAAVALWRDVLAQAKAGNVGEWGDWR